MQKHIVVVGAGASGLAAGRKLHDSGYRVTIVEARDRIGGRAFTDYSLASHPIELGAEFIHGEHVITWELSRQYGLKTLETFDEDEVQAHIDGKLCSLQDLYKLEIISEIRDFAVEWLTQGEEDLNLFAFIAQHHLLREDIPVQWLDNLFASDYSTNLDRLGTYGLVELSYEGDGRYDYRVYEGYSQLIHRLTEGLDIRLSSPIQRIVWHDNGAKLHAQTGEVFAADQVVVTLPLAILQNDDVIFEPPLPHSKMRAIHGLGAGHVAKIILKFSKPFWPEKLGMVVTALDTQVWWQPGWNYPNEAPVLTALVGGKMAEVLEKTEESVIIRLALDDLSNIFEQDVSPMFVEGRVIKWGVDLYAKMGYSYVPVHGAGLRKILATPLNDVLFFAGEATHVTRAATVHGAIESGFRAADEIIAVEKQS